MTTNRNDGPPGVLTRGKTAEDTVQETGLRPRLLQDYVGQKVAVENLEVFIGAARKREEVLDHVLFHSPPGLGKTTLAHIIANELGVGIHITSGPALERKGDLAGILSNLKRGDVLFIDEIHRLNPVIEENLYPAMEDFEFDIVLGEGPHARSIKMPLEPFTLIGATTRQGLLTSPMRDRFGIVVHLQFYPPEELQAIVHRSAGILDIGILDDAALEIASRSRGTPRISNRLLRRVRDFADYKEMETVDRDLADWALTRLEVDNVGLNRTDRAILAAIIDKFDGGPVGLSNLSATISEEMDTIEEVYEPFLIQQGYMKRTPQGRVATHKAYTHLGVKARRREAKPGDLFAAPTDSNKDKE